jgi:hypothetical protein
MKIKFYPVSKHINENIPSPKPAAKYIPEWYKNKKRFDGKSFTEVIETKSFGIKSCVPFLDSMINGYVQETWCDIYIDYDKEKRVLNYFSAFENQIIRARDSVNTVSDDLFYPVEFIWTTCWSTILPKGYSALITHPLNHLELPFFTLSAIIDFDKYKNSQVGNIPFYIKKDFTGLIPAGTPMYQIIPIKRENWESEALEYNEKENKKIDYVQNREFFGVYKKYFHSKKEFK